MEPRIDRDPVENIADPLGEDVAQPRALALVPVVGVIEFRPGLRGGR